MSESTVDSKKKPSVVAKTASKATTTAPKSKESAPKSTPPKAEKLAAPAKVSTNTVAAKPPLASAETAPPAVAKAAPAKAKPVAKTAAAKAQLPDQDAIDKMVNEAAYYLAEKRNFAPGYEEEDWLAAKKQIMAQLKGAKKPQD